MKRTIIHLIGILLLSISVHSLILVNEASAQDNDAVSLQVFYDNLHPNGQWISDDQYGYAWVPNVEDDFRPYATNGYWVMTEFGNTWVSAYPWGWAPFHYGRWIYDPYYGWVWIPGYEWGPAWVCWRHGGGYYGWAPLGPWFTVTVTFGGYTCPSDWWIFIPQRQLYHRWPRHRPYNNTVINNTTIIVNTQVHNHITHVTGPGVDEVRSVTGNNVQVYNVQDVKTPGAVNVQGNAVHMFRPTVSRSETENAPIKPANVIRAPKAISAPGSVRPNDQRSRPVFRNETQPAKQPRTSPVHTTPIPTPTPTPSQRKPVITRPQQNTRPATVPNTRPVQPERRKPMEQPKSVPQQKTPQKARPATVPQRPGQPVRK